MDLSNDPHAKNDDIRGAVEPRSKPTNVTIRLHRPGDIGHITSRHGIFYAEARGWDARFESMVARIGADFIDNYDPSCERLWIADDAATGSYLGNIMLVRDPDRPDTAKLRILFVETSARGRGVGTLLVQECVEFARQVGYKRIGLWTQDFLLGARKIYGAAGFKMTSVEKHNKWGIELVGEFWELQL